MNSHVPIIQFQQLATHRDLVLIIPSSHFPHPPQANLKCHIFMCTYFDVDFLKIRNHFFKLMITYTVIPEKLTVVS